jgi:hypothetical protein
VLSPLALAAQPATAAGSRLLLSLKRERVIDGAGRGGPPLPPVNLPPWDSGTTGSLCRDNRAGAGFGWSRRRIADDLLDAAAQVGGRHLAEGRPSGVLGGRCRIETRIARPVKLGCAWTVLGGQQNAAKSKSTFARAPFKNVAILICRAVMPLPA